jgi:hypothetical protein
MAWTLHSRDEKDEVKMRKKSRQLIVIIEADT